MKSIHENLKSAIEVFYEWEKKTPNNIFLRQPQGDTWKTTTFKEAADQARKIVIGLRAMGLKKGEHIGILSKNCAHWIIADLAIMMGGYVSVPFYASLDADQLAEVLEKSDCKALFVGKLEEWAKKSKGVIDGVKVIRFPDYPNSAKISAG